MQDFQSENLVECCQNQMIMMIEPSIHSKNLTTIELFASVIKSFYRWVIGDRSFFALIAIAKCLHSNSLFCRAFPVEIAKLGERYKAAISVQTHFLKVMNKYAITSSLFVCRQCAFRLHTSSRCQVYLSTDF